MPSSTEPRSGLLYGWAYGENGWNTGMDGNLLRLGRFGFHLSVKDRDAAVPPSPTSGACYLVGPGATGDWAGRDGQIAVGDGTTWQFASPRVGWRCYVEDEDVMLVFKTGGWGVPTVSYPGTVGMYKPFRGAMAKLTADFTLAAPPTPVPWQDVDYDTSGFWSAGNPSRLTIPAGVKKVRLHTNLQFASATFTSATNAFVNFLKNGSNNFRGNGLASNTSGYQDSGFTAVSGVIPVVAGDYFEVRWQASRAGTAVLVAASSQFSIEVVEAEETLP